MNACYFLYSAKLDWTLSRGFRIVARGKENNDYRRSDHKLLWIDVLPVKTEDIMANYEALVGDKRRRAGSSGVVGVGFCIIVVFVAIAVCFVAMRIL